MKRTDPENRIPLDSTSHQPSGDEGLPLPLIQTEEPAADAAPPPKPTTAHLIFIGPLGPRAGWSLLIYLIIATGIPVGIHFLSLAVKSARDHSAAVAAKAAGKPAPAVIPANAKPDPKAPAPLSGMIIGESLSLRRLLLPQLAHGRDRASQALCLRPGRPGRRRLIAVHLSLLGRRPLGMCLTCRWTANVLKEKAHSPPDL